MTADILAALAVFSFVSSVTPGPNNLMLLASGVNFGFRRSAPHMLGIALGFAFMLACVGLGLGQLLRQAPALELALKIAGGAYLLWLAWKIANSGEIEARAAGARPLSFLEAAAFQWVNPKGWMMAVTAMTAYAGGGQSPWAVAVVTAVFTFVGMPAISIWCGMGVGLRDFLSAPARLRAFNRIMAILLVASLWPMLR